MDTKTFDQLAENSAKRLQMHFYRPLLQPAIDALNKLGRPELIEHSFFAKFWNKGATSHLLEFVGYRKFICPWRKNGAWPINKRNSTLYENSLSTDSEEKRKVLTNPIGYITNN